MDAADVDRMIQLAGGRQQLVYVLEGNTQGDDEEHLVAREELLRLLLHDEVRESWFAVLDRQYTRTPQTRSGAWQADELEGLCYLVEQTCMLILDRAPYWLFAELGRAYFGEEAWPGFVNLRALETGAHLPPPGLNDPDEIADVLKRRLEKVLPRGKHPRAARKARIRRDVRWLLLHRLGGMSFYAIAKGENDKAAAGGAAIVSVARRSGRGGYGPSRGEPLAVSHETVRSGIERARRLLIGEHLALAPD